MVNVQLSMSSARDIFLSTGSVSRNSSAISSDTMVAAAAMYITWSGSAGQPSPVSRRMKAMCGA